MSYYYLIASLPYITFETPLPFATDEFLAMCEGVVNEEQLETLKELSLLPREQTSNDVEEKWAQFEINMRNWIVHSRAQRTKTSAEKFTHETSEYFKDMEKWVADAFDEPNPLKMDHALDQIRWKQLDDLEAGHDFDFVKLQIYKLKLMILEKTAALDKAKGDEAVHKVVEDLIANAGKETA